LYQRRCARYPVHFRSTLSTQQIPESNGTAKDLSIRGCRIESFIPILPSMRVRLTIDIQDHDVRIEVEQAVVRWVSGNEFGVEFVTISPESFTRLTQLIQQLPTIPDRP
jgi:hypothetical protein